MLDRRSFLCRTLQSIGLTTGLACFAKPNRAGRIHIGAQTNTWGAPIKTYDHLLEILDKLVGLGYRGFETNYMSLDSQASHPSECRAAFESRHIRYVAPHASVKLWAREGADAEIEQIRRIAGYSAQMGAAHLIASGGRPPHTNAGLDRDQIHAVSDGLNRVGQLCRQEGLKFCYHNHVQEFQGDPSEMSFLLRDTDPTVVWLNYDIGNAYPVGPDPGQFSAEHFRRIAIYHIKDVREGDAGKAVPTDLGAGKIDIKAVVAPLLDSDWQGWLVVEREESYPKGAANPEVLLRQCRSYLKDITAV